MAELNFCADEAPESEYDALPAGDYLVQISDSDFRESKAGNSQYLSLTIEVIDGPRAGRLLWENFVLSHQTSSKAVDIGKQKLAALCRAVGVLHVRHSEELHGIPFYAKITVEEGQDGTLQNRVKKYASAQKAQAPAPAPRGPAPQAAPATRGPVATTAHRGHVTPPPARTAAPWASTPRTAPPQPAGEEDAPF